MRRDRAPSGGLACPTCVRHIRAHVQKLRDRLGAEFQPGLVGYAAKHELNSDRRGYAGYATAFDLSGNGVIDEEDLARVSQHVGRGVRHNLYLHAYFGGDWLTAVVGMALDPAEPYPGTPTIADYEYGAGHDAIAGIIRLIETPGLEKPAWIEYHHDAPAEAGEDNIRVHLCREID